MGRTRSNAATPRPSAYPYASSSVWRRPSRGARESDEGTGDRAHRFEQRRQAEGDPGRERRARRRRALRARRRAASASRCGPRRRTTARADSTRRAPRRRRAFRETNDAREAREIRIDEPRERGQCAKREERARGIAPPGERDEVARDAGEARPIDARRKGAAPLKARQIDEGSANVRCDRYEGVDAALRQLAVRRVRIDVARKHDRPRERDGQRGRRGEADRPCLAARQSSRLARRLLRRKMPRAPQARAKARRRRRSLGSPLPPGRVRVRVGSQERVPPSPYPSPEGRGDGPRCSPTKLQDPHSSFRSFLCETLQPTCEAYRDERSHFSSFGVVQLGRRGTAAAAAGAAIGAGWTPHLRPPRKKRSDESLVK